MVSIWHSLKLYLLPQSWVPALFSCKFSFIKKSCLDSDSCSDSELSKPCLHITSNKTAANFFCNSFQGCPFPATNMKTVSCAWSYLFMILFPRGRAWGPPAPEARPKGIRPNFRVGTSSTRKKYGEKEAEKYISGVENFVPSVKIQKAELWCPVHHNW